jgi:FkbM family methyltransferase
MQIGVNKMNENAEYLVKYRGQEIAMVVRDPNDVIQKNFINGRFYELEELEYLKTLVPPKSIIADVGANVGNHTLFFSAICRASKVIPFEVNESATELLKINVERNVELTHIIDLSHLGIAVGKTAGFVEKVADKQSHNLGATSFLASKKKTGYEMRSLDQMLSGIPIDFMKIDVEGMEFEVLEGASNIIDKFKPILFVEVRKVDLDKFYLLMSKLNYRIERTFQRYRGVYNFLSIHGCHASAR